MRLSPVTAREKIVPIALQDAAQTHQCGEAWEVLTGFNALNIARAYLDFLRQFLLRQLSPRP